MILRLLQSLVLSMCKFYIGIWLFLYVAPKLIRLLERPEQAPDVTLPEGHPGHARQCYNRAVGLLQRAGTVRDPQMADEMVAMARKALIFCPNNDNDRRNRCWILSSALFVSSVISDDDRLLHESIERAREAWALSPRGHPERARACANLAKPLNHLYKHTGSEDLWNEAVDLQREALSLYPVRLWRRWIYDYLTRRPSQLALCQDLATSLATRYKRTSDEWCLDEAIALRRKMLSRCPAWYPERAKACSALAKLLAMRYKGGDNERLLDELISLQREAFDLRRPQGDWADIGAELAEFLWIRFEISGADTILDEIIDIQRSVLALRPRGHKSRGSHCVNLGRSLSIYYERNGDGRFLDEAIDLLREAHPLCSLQAPSRWIYAERLAHSLFLRYRTTRADELLKEAIHLQREAYDICPVGPTTYVNRASMLWNLYIFTHDDSLLDEINLLREAVNLCPVRHRPQLCEIVAHSYMKRYESNGDGALLSDIFHFAHEAKAVAPMHRVWRSCCRLSWVHGRRTSTVFYDLGQAIQYLSESLQHEPDDIPYLVTNIVNRVGHLWDHDVGHKQTELTAVYQRLVNLLPLVANSTLVIQPQRRAFERFKNVGSDAFVSATLAGNSKLGLEMLEVAQGAVWSQTLRYRDPQLQRIPEPARSELKGLLNAIGERTSRGDPGSTDGHDTTLTPRDGLLKESPRAYAAIAKIRALPGFDRFMLGETYESLCMAASTHPVVVLVGARGYFYALVISPSQAHEHALLSLHLTDEEMKTISFTPSVEAQQGTGEYVPEESLHRQLEVLWFKVVKPVLDHLDIKLPLTRLRPRLHWCTTGFFSALPIHAAGVYEGSQQVCCADFVKSSYTPTITMLLQAQRVASPVSRSTLTLALVAETHSHNRTPEVIHGVEEELQHVAYVANLNSIKVLHHQASATTVASTVSAMRNANMVHFACDGVQDISDVTESGFYLGDGLLTISKLMELKLGGTFLAFLSTFETTQRDKERPDQGMHMAAAMLFMGFKNVVTTMWAIADDDGPKVARWFYEELLSNEVVDEDSVAHALDVAVRKLRDSDVPLSRWAPFIHMGA